MVLFFRSDDYETFKGKSKHNLDGEIIERIKGLAEECDRSFSQYINIVLKDHLKNLDK